MQLVTQDEGPNEMPPLQMYSCIDGCQDGLFEIEELKQESHLLASPWNYRRHSTSGLGSAGYLLHAWLVRQTLSSHAVCKHSPQHC